MSWCQPQDDVDLYALDLLREWDVSVDEAVSLRRLNVRVAGRSGSLGIVQEDALLEDVRNLAEPSNTETSVQFVAKATYPTECEGKVALSVFCNDSKVVAKNQPVGRFWKLFNFQCEPGVVVRNVWLEWAFTPDVNDGHVAGTPTVVLDMDTGLQVRGVDVLPTLRCLRSGAVENWISRGHNRTEDHAPCRLGSLLAAPVCHIADMALEFVAHGVTGEELLDVFLNGTNLECQRGIEMSREQTLFRYVVGPVSTKITRVILVVTSCGKDGGVIIDPEFGFMVGGHDCLVTAQHMDATSAKRNPQNWDSDSANWGRMRSGQFLWTGCYILQPYRRTVKPYER
eukprot:CAMPEP_0194524524 /NCGR_PEP_ID=MMETSP0253-20130528/59712_1 /TAXON_ID=2966 /ORGANISM="Noctiluca scintillans" /LENGTH=340 /DNA_ID=CAMNT_0039369155 /DNA_START=119 /DNA_END=1142 /DNA_ORIENTATION=+